MNGTAARKERERAAREKLIVSEAGKLLVREGFQDLNLDELARAIEYAKGTIYLHFKTKEDLVLAVITRELRERADLLERAWKFTGSTRERAHAMSCACCQFASLHQDYFTLEMMLKSRSFWNRVSEERRKLHLVQSERIFNIVSRLVSEAIQAGDLPRKAQPREVTFSLVAITVGSQCAVMQPDFTAFCVLKDPLQALLRHLTCMIDGWGWKPLSAELDYKALERRIRKEVFPEASWLK
jgi:AcrR family transcriptional regulator